VAVVAPAAAVADAGTVRVGFEFEIVTTVPPADAAFDNVIVQVADAF